MGGFAWCFSLGSRLLLSSLLSEISSRNLGGRSTSSGIGSNPSGRGNEERRFVRRSNDQERKVPSILENFSDCNATQ